MFFTQPAILTKTLFQNKKIIFGVNFSSSFDEVLQDKDITAVAISTPAATHANFVKQSLLAGKDVFVEKQQRFVMIMLFVRIAGINIC